MLGIALRIAQWAWWRSYWGDEFNLLLNVLARTWASLITSRLDAVQGLQVAPPLFLVWIKAVSSLLGTDERVTRLLPLLCSCGALAVFARVALKALPIFAAASVVAVFALSDSLILQGATLKQYNGDVLIAATFLWLARPDKLASDRRWWQLCALAAAAVWFSHTAIIVFFAIGLARLLVSVHQRAGALQTMAGGSFCLTSFAAMYLLSASHQNGPYMHDFWLNESAFPVWSPWYAPFSFLISKPWELYSKLMGPVSASLLALGIAGVISLWHKKEFPHLLIWLGPLAVNLALAMLRLYPLDGGRVCMFLFPGLLLLAGEGALFLITQPARGPRLLAFVPAVVLSATIGLGLTVGVSHLFHPQSRGHLRPVAQYVSLHRNRADAVFALSPASQLLIRFYGRDMAVSVYGPTPAAANRFWIIRSYTPDKLNRGEGRELIAALSTQRPVLTRFAVDGADATLFGPTR